MNEKLINRIISVAYGDASLWEKLKINRLAKKNPEIKSILSDHRKAAQQVHNLIVDNCPDEVLRNVAQITKSEDSTEQSIFRDIYSFIFRRPAISTAILSLFILAIISTLIIKRPEIHEQYSKQEIELADKQVKHSLALISGIFKKTSITVEKDILTDRVSKPIKQSLNLVNEYLQGDNNENYN